MKSVVAIFGIALLLVSCQKTTLINLTYDPPPTRGITWKTVTIKRETADRYVMDSQSRNNLKDNLADTERYIDQQNNLIEFYRKKPNDNPK